MRKQLLTNYVQSQSWLNKFCPTGKSTLLFHHIKVLILRMFIIALRNCDHPGFSEFPCHISPSHKIGIFVLTNKLYQKNLFESQRWGPVSTNREINSTFNSQKYISTEWWQREQVNKRRIKPWILHYEKCIFIWKHKQIHIVYLQKLINI